MMHLEFFTCLKLPYFFKKRDWICIVSMYIIIYIYIYIKCKVIAHIELKRVHAGSSVNSIHDKSTTGLIIRHPPIVQLGEPAVVVLRDASFWFAPRAKTIDVIKRIKHDLKPKVDKPVIFKYTHLNTIKMDPWFRVCSQTTSGPESMDFGWTFQSFKAFKNTAFYIFLRVCVFSRMMFVLVWNVFLKI